MKLAECGCVIDAERNILATCQYHGMQLSLRGIQWTPATAPQMPVTVVPLTVGPAGCTCGTSIAGCCPLDGGNICGGVESYHVATM